MAKKITKPHIKKFLTILLIFALGIAVGFGYFSKHQPVPGATLITDKNSPKAYTGMNETTRNQFLAAVASSVLATLQPSGRSGLYTEKQQQQLNNTVSNINPQKDLYKDLGLNKGASKEEVQKASADLQQKLA